MLSEEVLLLSFIYVRCVKITFRSQAYTRCRQSYIYRKDLREIVYVYASDGRLYFKTIYLLAENGGEWAMYPNQKIPIGGLDRFTELF